MISTDLTIRQGQIRSMLEALESASTLTKWEEEFLTSIALQFERKGTLSDKQCEVLEKIYTKVF